MTRPRCAMCESFTTKGYPSEARHGVGRCTGFDMPGHAEQFVRADAVHCVIYGAGPNVAARAAFLRKFQGEAG